MDNKEINQGRRRFLTLATAGAGAIAAVGVATPLAASWFPSEKAKAAGASIEVDVSKIEAGQLTIAEWRGKPIFVLHRTPAQLKDLPSLDSALADPASTADQQPEYCKNPTRAIKENIWVAIAHLPPRCRRGRFGRRLMERRFLLPLPRLQIRLGRPCLCRRSCTDQSGHSSIQISE